MKKNIVIFLFILLIPISLFSQTEYTLTINFENSGTVVVNPPDVSIYSQSEFSYNPGTIVTLTGISPTPWPCGPDCIQPAFLGFEGDVESDGITVIMDSDKTVLARFRAFEPAQTPTPTPTALPTCQPAFSFSYGYITDRETGEPVSGATITAEASFGSIDETTSDADGFYTLDIFTCMYGEAATFIVSAPGYLDANEIRSSNGSNNFALIPIYHNPTPSPTPDVCPPVVYLAEGYITNLQTDQPVSGATILVNGTQGSASTVSESDGSYTVYVPNCHENEIATFIISADGYADTRRSQEIELVNAINFSLCRLGDVTGDDIVDIIDALRVAQYYVGTPVNIPNICGADVNCDTGIDIIDALLIAQFYVTLIDDFPC